MEKGKRRCAKTTAPRGEGGRGIPRGLCKGEEGKYRGE